MKKIFIVYILLSMPLLAWCDNITFSDAEVKAICVKSWDTNGDGELSYDEAAVVTNIGNVFRGNTSIKSFDELQYLTGLTSIKSSAFSGCSGLTDITIPNSVTSIGDYAFNNCSSLTSVTIPNSVTSIGNRVFWGCSSLSSITIPNSVTSIGDYAFYNCSSLTSVTIPNSVTSIGGYAFYFCSSLTSVTIPNSVTSIGNGVFSNCSSLSSITIPNSVTSIGSRAFSTCTGLTNIAIPNSVTLIGDYAFDNCSGLTDITIPNSVTSIGGIAFRDCKRLTSITVLSSINFDHEVFLGCDNLKEVHITNLETWLGSSFKTNGGEDYNQSNPLALGARLYLNGTELTSITIPNTVKIINEGVFRGYKDLKSITIPNSVTTIGSGAFSRCTGLTNIAIPNSVTSIDSYVFSGCSGLTDITIPNSVTSIGSSAFSGCSGLTDITIPNSVTSIGSGVFSYCTGLTNITLSNTLSRIESGSFERCTSLTSIDIPNSVTSIGNYAFYYCERLKSISLGNSVTSIGENVFGCCSSLKSITIPSSVTSMGQRTIDCYWTRIVKVESKTPFNSFNSFKDANYAILYVPKGCKEIYKDWGGFGKIVEMVSDDPIPFEDIKVKKICVSNWDVNGDGEFSYNEALLVTSLNNLFRNNKEITTFDELQYFTALGDIEENAFNNCTNLKSIKIPSTVHTVGSYAFSNCEALTGIFIPKNVKEFGIKINKHYVNNIEIRDSVRTNPFSNCGALCSIVVENGNEYYDSRDNCNAVIETNTNTLRTGCKYTILPNSLVNIGNEAFQGCKDLVSLSFSNSLQNIGSYAFRDCINLDHLIIPDNIISIDDGAFQNCSKLSYLNIGNIINSLGNNVFNGCNNIAAIIWEGDSSMPNKVLNINNTNMLFYTKDASYAPSNIRNVIVNGTAKEIVLSDASSGNNFYCPREFTAEKISYTHNYRMTSGLDGQARGWESIALPFTVSEITHDSKGKLLPFGAWTNTSDAKPFWLCNLSSSGFTRATSIQANTPYIICMPNNNDYDSSFNLSGNVTFSATNVKVPVSSSVTTAKSNGKTFIPAFCAQEKASGVYALNVSNSYHSEAGGYTEGSAFVSDLRAVSPFEAYMTTDASNAKRAFFIEFSETTGIDEMPSADNKDGLHKIFNLNGQLVKKTKSQRELDEALKQLPTGVYIINGKKTVIKR